MSLLASEKIMAIPKAAYVMQALVPFASGQLASRVDVYEDPQDVLPVWRDLVAVAPASVYQTPGFLLPWLATRGTEAGVSPLFIVHKGADGTPLAMFSLGVKNFGLFRAGIFLGGKDSNFNFGLFRPGYAPDGAALKALFRAAARKMGKRAPHLMLLYNQPLEWNGWSNPLAALPRQWSPSFAYKAKVGRNAESYFSTQLSKESRKKLRKKENRLAELGSLRHLNSEDDGDAREQIIEAFFKQKIARFEMQNIRAGFKSPLMRRFVETALHSSEANNQGQLELHGLFCDDRIVAVYGGATHQGHFSAFFNSFDADPEIAKSSPGDLLLLKLIHAKCTMGVTSFDLGIGEARYKNLVCNETVQLFDSFVPVSLKGRAVAFSFAMGLRLKRFLKQNEKAQKYVQRARSLFRRKS